MKFRALLPRLRSLLLGRVARNIAFWIFIIFVADGYNVGNGESFKYRLVDSDWYVPVMAATLVIQATLMYVNNLLLIPGLLARRRFLWYILSAGLLCFLTGLATALLMKIAAPHLDVEHLHHAGFTTTTISSEWSLARILDEAEAFTVSGGFWLIAFTLAWYANDYARQHRALKESEAQRVRTELAFLRNQLNPHFLFNTLNNIYGLVYLKSHAAPELILKLSSLLRYLLYETNVETISWSQERAAIEAYAEIESLRLADSAQVRIDIQADAEYLVPPLLWLPVLENSFKHGSRLLREEVVLDFSIRLVADQLSIRASNRFEPAASASDSGGLGLSNLRKRLGILYPRRHEIRETITGNTYSILIDVKLTP